MNKNFLNNQNYILGETEKKQIVSQYILWKYKDNYIFYVWIISILILFITAYLKNMLDFQLIWLYIYLYLFVFAIFYWIFNIILNFVLFLCYLFLPNFIVKKYFITIEKRHFLSSFINKIYLFWRKKINSEINIKKKLN